MTRSIAARIAIRHALMIVWLGLAGGALAQTAAPSAADPAKILRPEVANAVNAAQDAARGGQKDVAESKLREAAATPNLSMFEQAVIERGRAGVSLSQSDWPQAIRSLEVVVNSNQF